MSKCIGRDNSTYFVIGEWVTFDHQDRRLTGQVVRVYNSRQIYHVDVNGVRYEVSVDEDNPRRLQ